MFKKNYIYPVFLVIFLSIVGSILLGFSIKYYAEGGKKILRLKNIVFFIAEIPRPIISMIRSKTLNPNKPEILRKHEIKKRFEKFTQKQRNALLVLPRYDHKLSRAVVDIVDLNDFEVIHTYKHDIAKMNDKVTNIKEFPVLKINKSPIRFLYQNPLLLKDGSLIGNYGPAFKIDICSNLIWINDEEKFHHSQMLDHEGNIWIGGRMNPKSKYVKKYSLKDYSDDSIIKINTNGKILYNKSITEILIENNIIPKNFVLNSLLLKELYPIHLNDIEPVLSNTQYWKQGDIFLSIRNQNAIIHYRPNTNKVINYITGPFAHQHDVDIISNKEISIFNNNNFIVNNKYSEVILYNFEKNSFKSY